MMMLRTACADNTDELAHLKKKPATIAGDMAVAAAAAAVVPPKGNQEKKHT
jgi:hypothetical protein